MNHRRLLMMGTFLIFVATTHAQQATTSANASTTGLSGSEDAGLPTVETQLKMLTEKLNLNDNQQNKIRPVLKELHDATEKLAQDDSLSHEERLAKVRPKRYKADKQIREILSDDQKKKLDAYEHGPHSEMHGNLSGTTAPRPPQI